MKKLWKGLSISLSLCLSCLFVVGSIACKNVEDYIPEAYGEWDGTYLYKGNARMTTTGEEYAPLVSEVTAFEKTYAVESCIDYAYGGDTVYLLLRLTETKDEKDEEVEEGEKGEGTEQTTADVYLPPFTATALVSYDMKEKTSRLLRYRDLESDLPLMADILGVSDDCLLIDGGMTWYSVDFDGEIIKNTEFSVHNGILLLDGYVVEQIGYELFYREYSEDEIIRLCDVNGYSAFKCDLVEKDGKRGFIIQRNYGYDGGKDEGELWSLSFYDLQTKEFYALTERQTKRWSWLKENEYFITYDRETTEATIRSGCFGVREETYLRYTNKNCKLYALDFSGEKVRVKEEYVFEPDKDFLMRYTATDECFYATAEWSEKVGLFKRTVWKTATYRYDYQTKTLTELELEEFNVGISQATRTKNREYEAVLDGITYYLEEEEALGMMGGIAWVYRFAREKDGQTEYLQFWTSDRKGTYPEKTDREFWRNAGETGEFKVLPY